MTSRNTFIVVLGIALAGGAAVHLPQFLSSRRAERAAQAWRQELLTESPMGTTRNKFELVLRRRGGWHQFFTMPYEYSGFRCWKLIDAGGWLHDPATAYLEARFAEPSVKLVQIDAEVKSGAPPGIVPAGPPQWPRKCLTIAPGILAFGALMTVLCRHQRRSVRLRRHMCPLCGYPKGTSPTCTECGADLAAARNDPKPLRLWPARRRGL